MALLVSNFESSLANVTNSPPALHCCLTWTVKGASDNEDDHTSLLPTASVDGAVPPSSPPAATPTPRSSTPSTMTVPTTVTTTTTTTTTTTLALKPVGNIAGIVLGPAEPKEDQEKQVESLVDAIKQVDTGGSVPVQVVDDNKPSIGDEVGGSMYVR